MMTTEAPTKPEQEGPELGVIWPGSPGRMVHMRTTLSRRFAQIRRHDALRRVARYQRREGRYLRAREVRAVVIGYVYERLGTLYRFSLGDLLRNEDWDAVLRAWHVPL